jgi:hypothetical protein
VALLVSGIDRHRCLAYRLLVSSPEATPVQLKHVAIATVVLEGLAESTSFSAVVNVIYMKAYRYGRRSVQFQVMAHVGWYHCSAYYCVSSDPESRIQKRVH